MIINPYQVLPSSSYDPDAQAFFNAETAAGVTLNTTQMNAVNTLVVNLKAANVWTKFRALYPIVGGTATAHKFNLINPADTNAAFRLVFTGGWVHSANGMLGNASNTYANTFLNPTTQAFGQNEGSYGMYSRTARVGLDGKQHGVYSVATSALLIPRNTAQNAQHFHNSSTTVATSVTNSAGMIQMSRTSSTNTFQSRSDIVNTVSLTSTGVPNGNFYFGARNNLASAVIDSYDDLQIALCYIAKDGFTLLEQQVINQIVEGYQFALSRNIETAKSFYYNTAYSNETNAFLYATQITDTTIQTATNTLVSDLKSYGVWTKCRTIYPMVGGTATTHKYNLVNAQDTNAAFRLTFTGGWVHSSNGALPNGTNSFANTFLNSNTNLPLTNAHLSYYSRTNSISATVRVDIGSLKSSPDSYSDLALCSNNLTYFRYNNGVIYDSVATANTQGFYVGTRTANNIIKTFKNGSLIINGTAPTSAASSINFYIGAVNNNGTTQFYSDKQCAIASIGEGLTDTEAINFRTAVQAFNTTLGRQV